MSISSSLDRVKLEAAREMSGDEIVVVTPQDEVVERYRLLRYAGPVRGKKTEAFAVKTSTDKFMVRSCKELGLSDASPYTAYMAEQFDKIVNQPAIDLTDAGVRA